MIEKDIYSSLTAPQLAAVQHVDGPLLMLAGPGSGKTRAVTHRIAHLIAQGIPPQQILALTFTNKAADEMRARLQLLAPHRPVWMGTFHRFCARLLRRYASLAGLQENYSIYDTDDSGKTLKRTLAEAEVDLTWTRPERIANAISWAKNELITPDRYQPKAGDPLGKVVSEVYPAYQQALLASNAVDFDDLLLHVAVMLRENPELRSTLDERYRYIMVDEYQDTNFAQYAIVRALSIDYPNLAVTGDPDQSIYGWRGASLRNILDFEKDFDNVAVVRLEQNYRSTKAILRVAHELISHNTQRKEKDLFTDNPEGEPVALVEYPTHRDEAAQIAHQIAHDITHKGLRPRDVAVFYRVNALSRTVEQAMVEAGVPFQIVNGHAFYQRKEIKDVLAYLQLLNNPQDDGALLRVINTPPRGIGKTTLNHLAEHARRHGLTRLEAARECGLIESIKARSRTAIKKFVELIDRLISQAAEPVEAILGHVLTESGYQDALKGSPLEEDQERLANIEELLTAAREFDAQHEGGLEAYLEQASLVADTDAFETEVDKVTLMTLHAAKGLEFAHVYLIALEEGLLPHERSRDSPSGMEEERRLLFVGITRAQERLQISYAMNRNFRGTQWPTVPSSFLMELPRGELKRTESARPRYNEFSQEPEYAEEAWVEESIDYAEEHVDEYVQEDPEEQAEREKKPSQDRPKINLNSFLMTGADLLEQQKKRAENALRFKPGMLVEHAEHGLGVIVALSGGDRNRVATIEFEDEDKQRKFRLSHTDLTLAPKK
ncbi:ATP-dependent helicase [Lignipirellula cremea]|uniref:DNA 3'-5' helicase n=1 Tax=Lignipirellula cremea TaxID=2528010 RepID=A0A518DX27_9BACT|nr:UvrD-helicase domain-containing protein [Lignipirellula cremea]QDU96385.1 ATP-dependent DNA helicase PcrA [Lignipirellula cremea]